MEKIEKYHEYNEKNINMCKSCKKLYDLHGPTDAQLEDYHEIRLINKPKDYIKKRFDATIKDFANPPKGYTLQAKPGIFQSQKYAYEYVANNK